MVYGALELFVPDPPTDDLDYQGSGRYFKARNRSALYEEVGPKRVGCALRAVLRQSTLVRDLGKYLKMRRV